MSKFKNFLEDSGSESDKKLNNTLNKIVSYVGYLAIGIVLGYIVGNILG